MTGTSATPSAYVHGYSPSEATRLADQADTLAELLHRDTRYPAGARVLEAGCGVGAQTRHLVGHSPAAHFVCVDRARASLDQVRATLAAPNVELVQADLFALPFPPRSFDHVFVCFVLEHVAEPVRLLRCLKAVVRPGGSMTVIEGDHGSAFFHPTSAKARRTIEGLVEAQARAGGDANIGRRLFPLLAEAGLRDVTVSPRFVYADDSRPGWVDGFTRKTFVAMVAGARTPVLRLGLVDEREWDDGMADLERSAAPGGTFCYTFFKATATVG